VAAACLLFNHSGVQGVGVDAIMASAGVARNTFYRYFPSKDLLVVAYFERVETEWRTWLGDVVGGAEVSPHARLVRVFEVLAAWFDSPTFRGSPMVNVATEVGDRQPRVAELAREHSTFVHAFLAGLAIEAGVAAPDDLAYELQILLNGAVTTAQLESDPGRRRAVALHAGHAAAAAVAARAVS
jgi:AcrR family transcriptional regulator